MTAARSFTGRLERLLAARAPCLTAAAPAIDGGQGVLPFGRPTARKIDDVPSFEGRAPGEPWHRLDPGTVGPGERRPHRHGWLVRACGANAPATTDRALAALEGWLAQDRPGLGPAWVHTTDLTARLIHWLVALAWLGPAAGIPLRQRLAGSAAQHLDQLEARLAPAAPGDPRRALQLAGLVAGALGWPGLPGASARAGRALASLGPAFDALLDGDGAPRGGALPLLPGILCHGLVLDALCTANQAPLPRSVLAALRRAAALQAALLVPAGTLGAGAGLVEPLLPLDPEAGVAAVHNACVAAGWVEAPPLPGARRLAQALVGAAPEGGPVAPQSREPRHFRAAGLVLVQGTVAELPSQVLVRLRASSGFPGGAGSTLSIGWSVGDQPVLVPPHPQRFAPGLGGSVAHLVPGEPPRSARVLEARIRDRVMRVRVEAVGTGGGLHVRQVRLRGRGLDVIDGFRPPRAGWLEPRRALRLRVGWQLAPGWDLRWLDGALVGSSGGLTLRVELDPALTWSLARGAEAPGGGWVEGPGGEPLAALLLLGEGPLPESGGIRCCFSLS